MNYNYSKMCSRPEITCACSASVLPTHGLKEAWLEKKYLECWTQWQILHNRGKRRCKKCLKKKLIVHLRPTTSSAKLVTTHATAAEKVDNAPSHALWEVDWLPRYQQGWNYPNNVRTRPHQIGSLTSLSFRSRCKFYCSSRSWHWSRVIGHCKKGTLLKYIYYPLTIIDCWLRYLLFLFVGKEGCTKHELE